MQRQSFLGGRLQGFFFSLGLSVVCAASADARDNQVHLCIADGGIDSRRLEVVYDGEGLVPCHTEYSKWGALETIGRAWQTPGVCEQFAQSVVDNLTRVGFSCSTGTGAAPGVNADPDVNTVQPGASSRPNPAAEAVKIQPITIQPIPVEEIEPAAPVPLVASPVEPKPAETQPAVVEEVTTESSRDALLAPMVEPIVNVDSATHAGIAPSPRVLNYLAALQAYAKADQQWAINELEVIERIGLDAFYESWETLLFSAIDANRDGQREWFVRTADCGRDECFGYLLQRSSARDLEGHYQLSLLMISESMILVPLNCTIPRGQWLPLYAQGNDLGLSFLRVYEVRDTSYQEINHCVEEPLGGDRAAIRWYIQDGQTLTLREDQAVEGARGDCQKALQPLYENCYVPGPT
jgi:hypothetical protein